MNILSQPHSGPMAPPAILPPRITVNWVRVIAIAFLFFLQFGLITLFVAQDMVLGQQIASIAIITGLCLAPFVSRSNFRLNQLSDAFPMLLLAVVELVSYMSNQLIFHYGWGNWLTYSYIMFPLLAYYLFWVFSISAADIFAAILLMAGITCVLVAIDSFYHIPVFDLIQRYTNADTGTRRVPILKNEVVFAFCLLVCDMYSRLGWLRRAPVYLAGLALIFYVISFCFESRIALGATMVTIFIFLMSRRITLPIHLIYLLAGIVVGMPALYYGLSTYIDPILNEGLGNYIANHNVEIRFQSNEYYHKYFIQTGGIGFGLMTLNQNARNFQSDGVPNFYNVADLGLLGALYQFGVVGLLLVLAATLILIYKLFSLGRRSIHPMHDRFLMTSCFVLGFTLQPIPMNFFTLNWTPLLGATLWYLMRRGTWEIQQIELAVRMVPAMTGQEQLFERPVTATVKQHGEWQQKNRPSIDTNL